MFEFVCLRLEETFLMDFVCRIGRPFITGDTENVTQLCVLTNVYFHSENALIWHSGYIRFESRKEVLLLCGAGDLCQHSALNLDTNTFSWGPRRHSG
jgi:hypothetical protein